MHPHEEFRTQSRRHFLTSAASGLGGVAMASLLAQDGALKIAAGKEIDLASVNPLAAKKSHFEPKAKSIIFIFNEGAPSQLDLFDPKPKLNELHGQPLPESFTKNVRFAFIKKETALAMGSKRVFKKYGQSGMDISDYLPHLTSRADDICLIRSMHTDAFNHHPGQLMLFSGVMRFGRPTLGSWLLYGLGSEAHDLPGYVVLTAGRGASGGASNWTSGFLPSTYEGVLFRSQGDPVLNLENPAGLPRDLQRKSLDVIGELNQKRFGHLGDPEIASRIASYELAFRMQASAPELLNITSETQATLDAYGVERPDPKDGNYRGAAKGVYARYALNCLLARRLVERGVRCVSIIHASWDHHSNLDPELKYNCGMADQPVSALLADLKQRGLLESTLVIWAGEFGRTPLGENRNGAREIGTGRDHHPFAFTLWMAGGGVKPGCLLGQTDDIGWNVVEDPVHMNDFHATILHLFGLDHLKLTYPFSGLNIRLTDLGGKVVRKILA
ncbi:MAG: DUF1501 domain-containing protein [Planctomycetia bacterium]|nr:DUF1501 domain-containing protein [Planctomycetia bacterium]